MFEEDIKNCLTALKEGKVVLYPTDTVWGVGCDATNTAAVEKIYSIKRRPANKSFILLLDDPNKLNRYIRNVPEIAWELIDASDKPITIVYPDPINLSPSVVNEDNTVAIRIVQDEFCKKLIHKFGRPIVSTSANFSGEPTASFFRDINPELVKECDYVVSYRQNDMTERKPSSIIKLELNGQFKVIRK